MTQEDKELLLKDLCGRLPYSPKMKGTVYIFEKNDYGGTVKEEEVTFELYQLHNDLGVMYRGEWISIDECKPCLFPMSKMTREQLYEIRGILGNDCEIENDFIRIINSDRNTLSYQEINAVFNYCYKHNLDINGLIPKGLAIDATGLNIY